MKELIHFIFLGKIIDIDYIIALASNNTHEINEPIQFESGPNDDILCLKN